MAVAATNSSRSNSSTSSPDDAATSGSTSGNESSPDSTTAEALSRSQTTTERLASTPTTSERLARELANDAGKSDAANESILDGYLDTTANLANEAPSGLTGAGEKLNRMGTQMLMDHPQITKTWESTESAWTGKGGFTPNARSTLENAGMNITESVNKPPPGSKGPAPGVAGNSVNTFNGNLAETAIADRFRAQGFTASQQIEYDAQFNRVAARPSDTTGHRFIDVEVERPHATDPRLNRLEHIESKAFRVGAGSIEPSQLAHDIGLVNHNTALRQTGFALERVGKVARPVGLVLDAVEVIGAIRKDGGIGEEAAKSITGIAGGAAGGWGGAATGAALGTAILPGVGTVVGGIVGGFAGAWGGENIAKGAFDTVKGWFS